MSAFEDQVGKIGSRLFREVVQPKQGRQREDVVKGPAFGVDTSVVNAGNGIGLAVSSDPLSLIPSLGLRESAWLSVHLLANDMATTGFAPQYAQFVLNLPTDLQLESFTEYWEHIHTFCDEIGVAITGGHTAQAPGQNSTTPGGGTMFLTAPLGEIVTGDGAEPGDRIVATKECALAASSILARCFPETVENELGQELREQGCGNFYRTSSLQDALVAAEALAPNRELKAMHDATEGGLLGAISEMAGASGCGFLVDSNVLPVGEAVRRITGLFEIDCRISVGAGSMIMAVKQGREDTLVDRLGEASIPATVVGEMTAADRGFRLVENGEERAFSFDGRDPYWQAYFEAVEAGWT